MAKKTEYKKAKRATHQLHQALIVCNAHSEDKVEFEEKMKQVVKICTKLRKMLDVNKIYHDRAGSLKWTGVT